jgi:hypothetical protein
MKVVYVLALDERGAYSAMVRVSVASVRLSNPAAHIVAVCDSSTDRILTAREDPLPTEVDEWVVLDAPLRSARYRSRYLKTRLRHEVVGPLLYLDGDTVVRGSLRPIFELDADVALAQNHSADEIPEQIWLEDANDAAKMGWRVGDVPYLNGGVMYWADTSVARRLATDWHDKWLACVAQTGREVDQPALNAALREVGPSLHILPHRYNAQFRVNLRVSIDAVILHYYASDPSVPTAAEQLVSRLEDGGPIPVGAIEKLLKRRHPWGSDRWIDGWVARRVAKKGGLDDVYSLWLTGRRIDGVRRLLRRLVRGREPASAPAARGGPR